MKQPLAGRILVVDDQANITDSVKRALERLGHAVDTAADMPQAWAVIEQVAPDLVICDVRLGEADGMDLLAGMHERHPDIPVIMMTGYASIESAVAAIKSGAADYLAKPFNPTQLRHAVSKALERRRLVEENLALRAELRQMSEGGIVTGESRSMRQLLASARTVAAADSSVLITGKSGTGKEVLARFIHAASPRTDRAFVTVNCAAIPASLLESELFGHRRGAFTGAVYSRRGSFELADGGTLFLDEIGEMPVEMQPKILRAIEERQIKRVGAEEAVTVDARVIAATNKDLAEEVKGGRFREDLFWRLNVVHFEVPPLAERPEDVVPFARHFLAAHAREQKKLVTDFSLDAMEALTGHDWPGNVRELRNAVERAVIFAEPGQPVRVGHLPAYLRERAPAPIPVSAKPLRTLREVEADHIRQVLEACGSNRARAAEILGVSPVTLWRWLKSERKDEEPPGA